VCLRCRHAARAAARDRLNRLMLRFTAVAIVVATFITAGAVGATAIRGRAAAANAADSARAADSTNKQVPTAAVEAPVAADSASRDVVTAPVQASSPAPAPTVVQPARPAILPVIPMGQSSPADSLVAVRGDSDVVVSFDNSVFRTRRAEKFEWVVRTTLPFVYGAAVKEQLAKLPEGAIASQGNLLTELPARGVRIPVTPGWSLRVYPITRPGQDGPLVIRYRVLLSAATE
jgi:hypothetical protein